MRRYDPDRRDRIIDACIRCIAAEGVAGTSHRKVAAAADVPLGSMTYHFENMDELLIEAFTRFSRQISDTFQHRLAGTSTADDALDAIVTLIHADLQRSHDDHVLTYELYTLAARDDRFRQITEQWMHASREVLRQHFPEPTARLIDAFIEGAALHLALDSQHYDRTETRAALTRLAETPSAPHPPA